jgi:hypothetical protein
MEQLSSRRGSLVMLALVGVMGTLLAALPVLGVRLGPDAAERQQYYTAKSGRHHSVFLARVQVSGDVRLPLTPGAQPVPIPLTFHNGSSVTVRMTKVRVRIKSIDAPNATAALPCRKVDFEIRQMKLNRLRVPVGRTTLSRIGLPVSAWPTLAMRNLPTNQDGCKGAQLVLRFRSHQVPTS